MVKKKLEFKSDRKENTTDLHYLFLYFVYNPEYRGSWIESLKENSQPHHSPGQKLLFELNVKMCTVEILRILLDDCRLFNILSIISDPGITVHVVKLFFNTIRI